MGVNGWELFLILLIILILFGSTKIPKFMKGLGEGVHEFKKGLKDGSKDSNVTSGSEKKD